jgi:HPt (histidine-containing phosphotransfer) domain-containing protein
LTGRAAFKAEVNESARTPLQTESLPGLDLSVIESFRADSGEEMLQMLIETFLSDAASKLERLAVIAREPASKASTDEAIRIVHSLKSAGAMAGASALSLSARQLEARLVSGVASLTNADADVLRSGFYAFQGGLRDAGLVANG